MQLPQISCANWFYNKNNTLSWIHFDEGKELRQTVVFLNHEEQVRPSELHTVAWSGARRQTRVTIFFFSRSLSEKSRSLGLGAGPSWVWGLNQWRSGLCDQQCLWFVTLFDMNNKEQRWHENIVHVSAHLYNSDLQTCLITHPYVRENNYHTPPILTYILIYKYLFINTRLFVIPWHITKNRYTWMAQRMVNMRHTDRKRNSPTLYVPRVLSYVGGRQGCRLSENGDASREGIACLSMPKHSRSWRCSDVFEPSSERTRRRKTT
jgi:hypothetical protein